jgi:hypothetical protein
VERHGANDALSVWYCVTGLCAGVAANAAAPQGPGGQEVLSHRVVLVPAEQLEGECARARGRAEKAVGRQAYACLCTARLASAAAAPPRRPAAPPNAL